MREMSEIEAAGHAKQVLDNPMYRQSMMELKADLIQQWQDTKWFQRSKREKIWTMMQGVVEFERKMKKALADGIRKVQEEERAKRLKAVR
jgi:lantibiotic modifying enzyme